jgi:UDP-3-O-[3-hydroxymyristoyl] N-acetylglucosamine deacetylase/3-hydroxyacyl-[acyl-carrier-protein] dehydratase
MTKYKQHTIVTSVSFSGKGLHSGADTAVILHPAPVDNGIVFLQGNSLPAHVQWVSQTNRAVTLSNQNIRIQTVEHLLAAMVGLHITNVNIEITGPEIPILDGSAKPFTDEIIKAGIMEQPADRKMFIINEPFIYQNTKTGAQMELSPGKNLSVTCHLLKTGKVIQSALYSHCVETFLADIAPARTYGYISELRKMKQHHLIRGADYETGFIVLDEDMDFQFISDELGLSVKPEYLHTGKSFPVLSKEIPRFPDEMARHKILDILGDFSLSGYLIQGHIEAWGTGHADHIEVVKQLFHFKKQ